MPNGKHTVQPTYQFIDVYIGVDGIEKNESVVNNNHNAVVYYKPYNISNGSSLPSSTCKGIRIKIYEGMKWTTADGNGISNPNGKVGISYIFMANANAGGKSYLPLGGGTIYGDLTANVDEKTHKLSEKVNKVTGKSLIDENVAKYITYGGLDSDGAVHIDALTHIDNGFVDDFLGKLKLRKTVTRPDGSSSDYGYGIELSYEGIAIDNTNNSSVKVGSNGIVMDISPEYTSENGITVTANAGDITLNQRGVTHKLSEKANTSDVLAKNSSGDFVYGGTTISETQVSAMGHNLTNKWEGNVYDINVPVSTWTEMTDMDNQPYYYRKITVSNMVSNGQPMVDIVLSSNVASARKEIEAFQCVSRVVTGSGYIEMFCFDEAPTTAFTLRVLVLGSRLY